MSDTVISVKNLSKRYRIGAKEQSYKTFREAIVDGFKAPIRNLHRLRKLTKFEHNSGKESNSDLQTLRSLPSSQSDDVIWALKNLSFEVKRGEVIGIIGRNGAGKTTLLKILSRITEPTTGDVKLYGRVASLLEVGTGFHPELTGRENIYLNGSILGMRKAEINSKFDQIVDFAEIEKFIDTPVKRYSSGMYVRLAFAVAAHLEPEILLVDEVLAVGDIGFQKKCLGKMENISKKGRTVLFVSHNLLAVEALCQTGLLINQGSGTLYEKSTDAIEAYLSRKDYISGEVCWTCPAEAPGNYQARIRAVRIISDGQIRSKVDINKDVKIQIDYWNFQEYARRVISIHLYNSVGVLLLTTTNWKSVSLTYDPWVDRKYPIGLFRTSCVLPRYLLNTGTHSITVYINGISAFDNIVLLKNVISFDAADDFERINDFPHKWLGAIRPKLAWSTEQLDDGSGTP